jgi:hypothetical protein
MPSTIEVHAPQAWRASGSYRDVAPLISGTCISETVASHPSTTTCPEAVSRHFGLSFFFRRRGRHFENIHSTRPRAYRPPLRLSSTRPSQCAPYSIRSCRWRRLRPHSQYRTTQPQQRRGPVRTTTGRRRRQTPSSTARQCHPCQCSTARPSTRRLGKATGKVNNM